MEITTHKTTEQIKTEFQTIFPNLKIEFYRKKHETYQGSKDELKINQDMELEKLNPMLLNGEIDIDSEMTVAELENAFENKFGLHIQVYRKSGEQWMQTSITDHWTLAKQEMKSEDLDHFYSD
ncbi:hypothetical protein [Portibacter marinus]|uniref:hypothetical protein n=1 Tax=Portibacter marinus TaxID=2898660 RepID=UPI001F468975|nr:hypothetical protein [Portibacter marinus]